ncbi:hypothetical protein AX16_000048 [Volvariella volvacea WC 439]|nr:hypothetical protein AX16_000048 [Volvariella volvacea WC 439]
MARFQKLLSQLVLASTLVSQAYSAIFNSPDELVTNTYDYVVVGGGNAGAVVAARLTENPDRRVLVLEAGGSDEAVLPQIPLLGALLSPRTIYDWNYTTTPQQGLNGRIIDYPRGRVLGGSSTINYMLWTAGSIDDFDRYAEVSGDPGWNWDNMQQYIRKAEGMTAPVDGHDTTGQWNTSAHGTDGPVKINLPNFPTTIDQRVIDTLEELSSEFPFTLDYNAGSPLGIGWAQSNTGGGRRSSSATAYIHPNANRPNLDVLLNAHVTTLVTNSTQNGLPLFNRVQFQTSPDSPIVTVSATREIVLSAGSVGTPAILQLSGIGDSAHLGALGIQTIVNLPSVGQNVSDHPLLPVPFSAQGPSFDDLMRGQDSFSNALAEWEATQSGPLSTAIENHLGFLRLPADHPIFDVVPDPSAGPVSSHFEMLFANVFLAPGFPTPETGDFMTIVTALISPTSRGNVTIGSNNPWAAPLINPNLVNSVFDLTVLREAVKACLRFVSASPWQGYINSSWGDLSSDDAIDAYVRNTTTTVFHPVGTASMSPVGADWGVVDPDLKVKGVEGLRVVDASVLPFVPNAHTQAPVFYVAERGADLIKADDA